MNPDKLEKLRAKYGAAAAGDVHDPEFKKVVDILFSGADRRAKPYEGVSTFLDLPLLADAHKSDDIGGLDVAIVGVPDGSRRHQSAGRAAWTTRGARDRADRALSPCAPAGAGSARQGRRHRRCAVPLAL